MRKVADLDPLGQADDVGVDAGQALLAAADAPRHDADLHVPARHRAGDGAHQRRSAVALPFRKNENKQTKQRTLRKSRHTCTKYGCILLRWLRCVWSHIWAKFLVENSENDTRFLLISWIE